MPGISYAAVSRIQVKHQYPATSGTAYPFASNNTAGDFIVIVVSGSDTAVPTIAVSDSAGNSYSSLTLSAPTTGGQSVAVRMFYAANILGGANSVTVTATNLGDIGFTAVEYSGVKTVSPLDTEATPTNQQGFGATTATSTAFAPQSGSLIFAGYANETTDPGVTTGTGVTVFQSDNTHFDIQGDSASASAGSQAITFTLTNANSARYAVVAAAFLAAASTPGVAGTPARLNIIQGQLILRSGRLVIQ